MTFLERMAKASRERVRAARAKESEAKLERRALDAPAAPPLGLDRFDVIAELKLRSPSAGGLARGDFDSRAQLAGYARGGAAAVSVLTEPTEFRGELEHLAAAAEALRPKRPVMRKDFLVDPYQVLEARAAGAGGVLVILAMLDDAAVRALVDCARGLSMFVLLEAFDRADLERLSAYDAPRAGGSPLLAGVNCRDLRDLEVRFERFAELGPYLPRHLPTVAESGIVNAGDVEAVVAAGFRLALVGSSLMRASDPAAALAGLVAAGRAAVAGRQARCS
ncbi:MAG TPA: indole-3-glycerol phosphate synthase TrpC [Gammaproteobacteria bacterium]|nr:indole-3-glycerol phosphate synthase TrpC [Gammaproteobacteria bacterium]